jgi:hypothetical protein
VGSKSRKESAPEGRKIAVDSFALRGWTLSHFNHGLPAVATLYRRSAAGSGLLFGIPPNCTIEREWSHRTPCERHRALEVESEDLESLQVAEVAIERQSIFTL